MGFKDYVKENRAVIEQLIKIGAFTDSQLELLELVGLKVNANANQGQD